MFGESSEKKDLGFGSNLWMQLVDKSAIIKDASFQSYIDSFQDCQKNFAKLNSLYEKSLGNILVLKKEIDSLKNLK